ncbi:hypothetical protein D9M72_533290 [compost metagenome]
MLARLCRAGDADRAAIDEHRAAQPAQNTEQREKQIALPLPVQTAETDNFARM